MDRKTRHRYESLAGWLEYALGRAPDEFGIVPDPEGWIELKRLVQALSEDSETAGITANQIRDLAWALPDCPFEFQDEKIRCLPARALLPMREPATPPAILYLGCRRRAYRVYLKEGASVPPGGEIILARTREMALRIGKRRDPNPVVAEVQTAAARETGTRFISYGVNLFLVDWLDPEALYGPPLKEEERPPKPKPKKTEQTLAPTSDSVPARPWDPNRDRLVARTPEEERQALKRARADRRIDWKEAARAEKRRSKRKGKGREQ